MKKLLLIFVLLISNAQALVIGTGIIGPGTFVSGVYKAYRSDGDVALVKVRVNTDRGPMFFYFEHPQLNIVTFEGHKYITFFKTTCAKKIWGDNWRKYKMCKLNAVVKETNGILYLEASIEEGRNL